MAKSWIKQIFNSKQARNGGVARRSLASISRYASLAALKAEVARRHFHMIIIGDQAVITCNNGDLALVL